MPRTVHAVCSHDCPDSCGVLVTIDETGRATQTPRRSRPSRHPRLPLRQSGAIPRPRVLARPPALSHAPPRRRPKARCPKAASRSSSASPGTKRSTPSPLACAPSPASSAPNPSCPTSYAGTMGCSATAPWIAASSTASAPRSSTAPSAPRPAARALTQASRPRYGTEPEQFRHAKLIIAWGANILGTNVHLWPFIVEARRNGAKLYAIDPYRNRTGARRGQALPHQSRQRSALALGHDARHHRATACTTPTTSTATPTASTSLRDRVAPGHPRARRRDSPASPPTTS